MPSAMPPPGFLSLPELYAGPEDPVLLEMPAADASRAPAGAAVAPLPCSHGTRGGSALWLGACGSKGRPAAAASSCCQGRGRAGFRRSRPGNTPQQRSAASALAARPSPALCRTASSSTTAASSPSGSLEAKKVPGFTCTQRLILRSLLRRVCMIHTWCYIFHNLSLAF